MHQQESSFCFFTHQARKVYFENESGDEDYQHAEVNHGDARKSHIRRGVDTKRVSRDGEDDAERSVD